MDIIEASGNWGDPYIGLWKAADMVRGFIKIAVDTPLQPLAGIRSALGSPTIWDDIAGFFRGILNWLQPSQWASQLYNSALLPLVNWWQWYFWPWIKSFADSTCTAIENWFGRLFDNGKNALTDKLSTIKNAITDIYNWVRTTFWSTVEAIRSGIASAYTWLSTTFNTVIGAIRDAAVNTYNWVITTATSIFTTVKQALVDSYLWVRDVAGPWLKSVPTLIWQGLVQAWGSVMQTLATWWKEVVSFLRDGLGWVKTTVIPTVSGWIEGFASIPATFLNWVAATAGTDLALHPATALATAGSLYVMSMTAGSGAHILSTALNLIPTLNWVGMSQLAGFVGEAAGFAALTKATYGVLVDDALSWPLRYHWNQMLRPRIPTEGEIYTMGRKRGLTRGEFGQAMAYQGLPDQWIDKEYQFFWTDPSPMWLLRMSEVSNPKIEPSGTFLPWLDQWLPNWRDDPWAWYRMKLMLAGFEDTDIPAFVDAFQRRMVSSAVTQVKTSVRAMVREAYWDRSEVEGMLRPLGVRQDEIEYLMMAEELDYQKGYLDDQVTGLLESFRKGVLSRQDLSLALSTIIVKPERVGQIVAREEVRALPKPVAIAPAKEPTIIKSLVTQAVSSWTKAYRDWKITADELELGLTIVLQDAVLAGKLVAVEQTRYRPAPLAPPPPPEDPIVAASRRAAIASWIAKYRAGEITADVMEMGLSPLIADRERLLQIRHLEELRAPQPAEIIPPYEEDPLMAAVREESVRGHLAMFSKRLISLGELYSYLVADGLAEALARATALTQAYKRIKPASPDVAYFQQDQLREAIDAAISGYTLMLEKGQITLEEFRVDLLAAGVDPDVVVYLCDTQEVRAFLRSGVGG